MSQLRSAGIHVVRVKCDRDILTDFFRGYVEIDVRHDEGEELVELGRRLREVLKVDVKSALVRCG
jgi:hypothetical protein